jgi:hypothetical protein
MFVIFYFVNLLNVNTRKKVRLKESNAKIDPDFAVGVFTVSVLGPLPSYDPISPPPLDTVYTYMQYRILIHTRGELTREKVRGGNSSQIRSKNMADCLSSL